MNGRDGSMASAIIAYTFICHVHRRTRQVGQLPPECFQTRVSRANIE